MNALTIGKYGFIGLTSISAMAGFTENAMKKFDTDVQPPIDTVSLIISSYNEENTIETAASSVREQSIIQAYPDFFELILVDSHSQDKTVELAKPYVDKIILAPRGKLTSKRMATDRSNGNIIVSTDSDCYYPYHWLNTLLKPFRDYNNYPIAGIVGSTLDYSIPFPLAGQLNSFLYNIIDRKILHRNQMIGRNCAYYKHLFYLSGGFNENVNQFNIVDMLNEEEIYFGDRISKYGKIVYKLNAPCAHLGGQKVACRFGLNDKKICGKYKIGIDRF